MVYLINGKFLKFMCSGFKTGLRMSNFLISIKGGNIKLKMFLKFWSDGIDFSI